MKKIIYGSGSEYAFQLEKKLTEPDPWHYKTRQESLNLRRILIAYERLAVEGLKLKARGLSIQEICGELKTRRDALLAGAGIRPGQVVGASDRRGAEVHDGKVNPSDLTATMAHLLGIGHHAMFRDKADRPHRVTDGQPIWRALA